jgi:hypothetical protein
MMDGMVFFKPIQFLQLLMLISIRSYDLVYLLEKITVTVWYRDKVFLHSDIMLLDKTLPG